MMTHLSRHRMPFIRSSKSWISECATSSLQKKFAQIRAEFDKVFGNIFGGGTIGSLELIEDEAILEAGIQIIAQTAGKETSRT